MAPRSSNTPDEGEIVFHEIAPLYYPDSRVLLLGSMPSPKSREASFYYGNPQNRFWQVLGMLWGEELPRGASPEEQAIKRDFCRRHHIALWDCIARCRIVGASDSSISEVVPNDVARLLSRVPIQEIFCTGAASWKYYHQLIEPTCARGAQRLPSTSPANAAWSLERLCEAWEPVRAAADA